jgi:hypothetical protein
VEISYPYTIIQGAPKSGKSYLIYDYLRQYKSEQYLYIDLNDIRIDKNVVFYNLDKFLLENNDIEVLIIDNIDFIPKDFIKHISHLKSIIISSVNYITYNNFKTINISPLSFEEYILFDNKHQNITNKFNSFFKYGNFCEIIQINETKQLTRNQEIIQLISDNKIQEKILTLLIKSSGELKSIFQLFNLFKRTNKISKDLFYNSCKQFEDDGLIYFCQKYKQPKAPKKIYCYNHALIDAVTINKKFNNIFSNMIFLELIKIYQDIYYLDGVDFYIKKENRLILGIPFFNNQITSLAKILPHIEEYNIQSIQIITVSTESSIFVGDIECEITPFYEWALGL